MLELVAAVVLCIYFLILSWSVYNIPIIAAGVSHLRRSRHLRKEEEKQGKLPSFSIIVPVRNEEKVIGRLLDALLHLEYRGYKEIIVAEDGSIDRTLDICSRYKQSHPENVKILHRKTSDGAKSAALNYGIANAKGDIIGIFDADNIPAQDILSSVCRYFDDPNVAAVQGRTLSTNAEENMLTKFLSYEDAVWCEAYLRGKDVLNLFVHLKGSCQFIRRSVIERLGFDEGVLSEDMEISARLTSEGYRIKYAPDVRSWQESPASPKQLFKQRTRWFRGCMEVAFKYGRLMSKPSRRSFDAEATLYGPFMLIISSMTFGVALSSLFVPFPADLLWQIVMQFTAIATAVLLFLTGLALIHVTKPKRARNLLWLPFIYFYWSLQALIAFYAAILIMFRRPRKWVKTEKTGLMDPGLRTA
jgi:cellulose synthase/poly-beta-1,6-N-acetylglucosamine synthase-like glycosyltransferase